MVSASGRGDGAADSSVGGRDTVSGTVSAVLPYYNNRRKEKYKTSEEYAASAF